MSLPEFHINDHIFHLRTMSIEPWIRYLKQEACEKLFLEITTRNFFRLMEMWKYSHSMIPRRSGEFYDPGFPHEEAQILYGTLDGVFREVFPAQRALTRPEAAEYMEILIGYVHDELVVGGAGRPGAIQHLLIFLERLVAELEKVRHVPLDCVEV